MQYIDLLLILSFLAHGLLSPLCSNQTYVVQRGDGLGRGQAGRDEVTAGLTGHSKERSQHLAHQFIVISKRMLHSSAP